MPYQRHDLNGNPVTPKPYQRHDENNRPVASNTRAAAAAVDTSFLDSMTKNQLIAWSEEQGWDLVNSKRKAELLAECKQIARGTFQGKRLA